MASRSIERDVLAAIAAIMVILAAVGYLVWYGSRQSSSGVVLPNETEALEDFTDVMGTQWFLVPENSYVMYVKAINGTTYGLFMFLNGTALLVSSTNATQAELYAMTGLTSGFPWCPLEVLYTFANGTIFNPNGFSLGFGEGVGVASLYTAWCRNSSGATKFFDNLTQTLLSILRKYSNQTIIRLNVSRIDGLSIFALSGQSRQTPSAGGALVVAQRGPYVIVIIQTPANINVTPAQLERVALLVAQGLP